MIYAYVLSTLSTIIGVLSGYFNLKKKPVIRIFLKGVASLLFMSVALVALFIKGVSLYSVLVIGALILGMVGDLYLCMNKELVHEEKANILFLIGGACFFGGHVLFGVTYLVNVPLNLYLIPCIFILPILLTVTLLLGKKKINLGKFSPMAVVYAGILNLTLVATINAFVQNQNTTFGVLSLVAGILFVISDCSLLFKEFSPLKGNPILIYVVLLTYYVAQCLFGISIFFY